MKFVPLTVALFTDAVCVERMKTCGGLMEQVVPCAPTSHASANWLTNTERH